MDQLIELALQMPPSVSAALSVLVLFVVWRLGKKLYTKLEGLTTHLVAIQDQTTKTNGSVGDLKTWRESHDDSDNQRHAENLSRFDSVSKDIRELRADIHQGGPHA